MVVESSDDQRSIPVLHSLVDSGLALDEQPRILALLGRDVQRGGLSTAALLSMSSLAVSVLP